ncbi:MAG: hypothetical protein ACYC26_01040 [Phycisphaerales bacterium]
MWNRLVIFVLTASLSVTTAVVAGVDDSYPLDDSDGDTGDTGDTTVMPLNFRDRLGGGQGLSQDAELIDDAVDDRVVAWVSLAKSDRDTATIHLESLAAINAQQVEQLLTPALAAARSGDALKLVIDSPPPPESASATEGGGEDHLRTFMERHGFHFHRARCNADGRRTIEFYTNLYYRSKDKHDSAP